MQTTSLRAVSKPDAKHQLKCRVKEISAELNKFFESQGVLSNDKRYRVGNTIVWTRNRSGIAHVAFGTRFAIWTEPEELAKALGKSILKANEQLAQTSDPSAERILLLDVTNSIERSANHVRRLIWQTVNEHILCCNSIEKIYVVGRKSVDPCVRLIFDRNCKGTVVERFHRDFYLISVDSLEHPSDLKRFVDKLKRYGVQECMKTSSLNVCDKLALAKFPGKLFEKGLTHEGSWLLNELSKFDDSPDFPIGDAWGDCPSIEIMRSLAQRVFETEYSAEAGTMFAEFLIRFAMHLYPPSLLIIQDMISDIGRIAAHSPDRAASILNALQLDEFLRRTNKHPSDYFLEFHLLPWGSLPFLYAEKPVDARHAGRCFRVRVFNLLNSLSRDPTSLERLREEINKSQNLLINHC